MKFDKRIWIPALCLIVMTASYEFGKYVANRNNNKTEVASEQPAYIGAPEVGIENGVMTPEVLLSLGRLSDPQLSPDGKLILYGVSYIDIAANRSCRNLYVCGRDGSGKTQLTREGKSISCARWSADGGSIYYLQGGQLYKAAFKAASDGASLGAPVCLSDVEGGIGEFSFSPDESMLMFTSQIAGPVTSPADKYPDLDKAEAYVADDLMYRHWDHWVTDTPRTYVHKFESDGNGGLAAVTKANSTDILGDKPWELPTEPFGGIEQLSWSPDGSRIAYSCRPCMGLEYAFSTNCEIYIYDVESGQTLQVTHGGGYDTDPVWSPDGSLLAWVSMARDGYEADRQRIMVYDPEQGSTRELTRGFIYDASGLTWTADSKAIVFTTTIRANGALCYVPVAEDAASFEMYPTVGNSDVRRLTPEVWLNSFDAPFDVTLDEQGIKILTGFCSMMAPTELVALDLKYYGSQTMRQLTHENDAVLAKLAPVQQEQIQIPTPEGETLYAWVLYPAGFAEGVAQGRKYPVVEMFNGGPQSSLDQHWSYRWNFYMMAQQGYVVLLPNRHGDSGFGQRWKEQISGDYQGLNMQDYMLAAKWARAHQWCGKVAGVGASYGGFSVYNMMGLHGDLFDCFIAHAGIFNEKQMWYTTEESWFANFDGGALREYAFTSGEQGPRGDGVTFGGMQQAGAPYSNVAKAQYHYANDPSAKVTKWHTPILCIHGMMDFRIPYEQGMAAFNAARMMGVEAKLIVFPEENHWIIQPQNALFWHREFFAWLDQHCK